MSPWRLGGILALALAALGCGETTRTRDDGSGNTNWLKSCELDAECGDLACLCGSCRDACSASTECSQEPEDSCIGVPTTLLPISAPRLLRQNVNANVRVNDLALGADGSVTLVGGTEPVSADLSTIFRTFWLSQLDSAGDERWTYTEPPPQTEPNIGRSVVLTAENEVVALSTIYDGADTPELRRFDAAGERLATWTSEPGFNTLRSDGRGGYFAAGSQLVDRPTVPGRLATSAWVGRFDPPTITGAETPHWQQAREGLEGSISGILTATSNGTDDVVVGGSLGTATRSNASEPYLARLDQAGNFLWEHSIPLDEVTHCNTTAVAFLADGASLAAIGCGALWLRAYEKNGDTRWERRFPTGITALAGLPDGGYAVALGGGNAVLVRYDAQHRLLWSTQEAGCSAFNRLAVTDGAVVALATCEGYVLDWFADP